MLCEPGICQIPQAPAPGFEPIGQTKHLEPKCEHRRYLYMMTQGLAEKKWQELQ